MGGTDNHCVVFGIGDEPPAQIWWLEFPVAVLTQAEACGGSHRAHVTHLVPFHRLPSDFCCLYSPTVPYLLSVLSLGSFGAL